MEEARYKVQINFSGLIALVPHASKKKMMVLMVDGSYPHRASDREELFPHFPFVHYRLDDLADESPRRPELFGKGYGLSFLSLEDLTIGEQPYDKPRLKPNLTSDNKSEEPVESQEGQEACGPEDLCWIMPMDRVGDTGGADGDDLRIAPECLAPNYKVTPGDNKIAARFQLCQGQLRNRDFHRKDIAGEALNSVCRFLGENSTRAHYTQMISVMMTYEPDLPENAPLKISSCRFTLPGIDKSADLPAFVFKNPQSVRRNVVINIWNAPFSDILNLLGDKTKHQWDHPTGDRSFRSYFRLCRKPPAELPVLQREGRIASRFQAKIDATEKDFGCPKARFREEDYD
jgi:hypothetical protein